MKDRHPFADGWKILFSLFAGPIGVFLFVLVVVFSLGRCSKADAKIQALRDTVRITDSVIAVRTDTLRIRLAAKLRTDTLVRIVSDTQVLVRDSLITVPPEIPERINACDCALRAALDVIAADSAGLRSRDGLIRALSKEPRVTKYAGIGYDPIDKSASVTAGGSINLWKGIGLDAYIDQPLIVGQKPYVRVLIGYWKSF